MNVTKTNMTDKNMEQESERLVRKEVLCCISALMGEFINQEKYFEDLSDLLNEEDSDGNIREVLEYWIVTPWLAEKLKAHGESVVTDFFNLDIWGRRTSGQSIDCDTVIDDITRELFAS